MTEPWKRTRAAFEEACELGPENRERYLRALGPALEREVRALLAADAERSLLDEDTAALQLAVLTAADADLGPGTRLGDMELVELLGEGGSARVWRARRADGSPVAVKILKAEESSPAVLRRFAQEGAALAELEHPGILRVLGTGTLPDGRPYLVTEYVEGVPIDRACDARGLDRGARLRLFVEVCRAVHHAHRHLIVHRDLKPSNILVTPAGTPKVLDFGIAKLLDPARDPGWTEQYGRGPLTPACASPEQLRGDPVSTATDVYSLGVLLYGLVTGASPYRGDPADRAVLERAVLSEPPRPPREAARAAGREPPPVDLETILACALAKEPERRYPSVEHLAEDLLRFLEHRPLHARREPWTRHVLRFVRRHPLTSAAGAGVLALFVGGWIGTQRSLERVRASESIAWRAHASAVRTTLLLAELLARLAHDGGTTPSDLGQALTQAEHELVALADEPEAEGRMRLALATARLALGELEPARAHAQRALELARTTQGFGWRDSARALELLLACEDGHDPRHAWTLAEERARLLRARLGPDDPETRAAEATLESLRAGSGTAR